MANQADKNVLGAEDLIKYLLKEPKIAQRVLASLKPQARDYTHIWVNMEEKRIYVGKYAWEGFSGFWQRLIKCFDHISYDDFCIKVWDALRGMTTNPVIQEAIQEGLSREVLLKGIAEEDQNILHRFFDVCRHLTDDGYWRDRGTKGSNSSTSHHVNGCPYAGGVEVTVENRNKKPNGYVTVRDAVGDVFEVLHVNWIGGRRQ